MLDHLNEIDHGTPRRVRTALVGDGHRVACKGLVVVNDLHVHRPLHIAGRDDIHRHFRLGIGIDIHLLVLEEGRLQTADAVGQRDGGVARTTATAGAQQDGGQRADPHPLLQDHFVRSRWDTTANPP